MQNETRADPDYRGADCSGLFTSLMANVTGNTPPMTTCEVDTSQAAIMALQQNYAWEGTPSEPLHTVIPTPAAPPDSPPPSPPPPPPPPAEVPLSPLLPPGQGPTVSTPSDPSQQGQQTMVPGVDTTGSIPTPGGPQVPPESAAFRLAPFGSAVAVVSALLMLLVLP